MSRQHFEISPPYQTIGNLKCIPFSFISPLQGSTSVSTVLNLEHRPPPLHPLYSWMYVCYFNSELRIDHLKGFQWHTECQCRTWRYPWKSTFTATERRACCSSGTLCRDRGALMCNTESWNLVKMMWKPLTSRILPSIQIVALNLFCSHPISLHYVQGILFVQQ